MQHRHHGHRALRRGRCSLDGQVYLITFVTRARTPVFEPEEAAVAACRALWRRERASSSQLLCWVLMPDHWHGLVRLDAGERLESFVLCAKAVMTKAANRSAERSSPVWARAFHDRGLRSETELLPAACYMVANPVRAGLVRRIGDYPYWDAVWL